MILVERIQHGFQELHEVRDTTDIFRWTAPLAVDERRVIDVGLAVDDRFDEDVMPPVVPEVVHVEEPLDPTVDERLQANARRRVHAVVEIGPSTMTCEVVVASTCSDTDLLRRITSNSAIFGGKPIIRSRRLAVEHVLGMLAAGDTPELLLQGYPWLEPEDIRACLVYARRVVGHERVEPALVETSRESA